MMDAQLRRAERDALLGRDRFSFRHQRRISTPSSSPRTQKQKLGDFIRRNKIGVSYNPRDENWIENWMFIEYQGIEREMLRVSITHGEIPLSRIIATALCNSFGIYTMYCDNSLFSRPVINGCKGFALQLDSSSFCYDCAMGVYQGRELPTQTESDLKNYYTYFSNQGFEKDGAGLLSLLCNALNHLPDFYKP